MNEIKESLYEGYKNKLKNKMFGMLCEFERDGEWETMLDSILQELIGFDDSDKSIDYYIIYYKLSASRYFRHEYIRKAVFDSMALIDKIDLGGNE